MEPQQAVSGQWTGICFLKKWCVDIGCMRARINKKTKNCSSVYLLSMYIPFRYLTR